MGKPGSARFSGLGQRVMEALWDRGPLSIREIRECLPAKKRPAYVTVQTTVYRLENKRAVRRTRKIGNADIFEAAVTRAGYHRRLISELLEIFGGRIQPVLAHWVEAGNLSAEDIREAGETLKRLSQSKEKRR